MTDFMMKELELEKYSSEFDTCIAILEYAQKCDLLESYYSEALQTPAPPPPAGSQPPAGGGAPAPAPAPNPNPNPAPAQNPTAPGNIKPTPGSTIPSPQAGQTGSTPAPTKIMKPLGGNPAQKRNIFQRIFDAIMGFFKKIGEFFSGKQTEGIVDNATQVVEKARSSGMSEDEFISQIMASWKSKSGGMSKESTNDNPTSTSGVTGTNGSQPSKPTNVDTGKMEEFYRIWFREGNIPTHMSKDSVNAMQALTGLIIQIAKELKGFSAQQIVAEGNSMIQQLNQRSEDLMKALNQNVQSPPSIWKTYFFMAGDMCRKMNNAFTDLQKIMNQLYADPEKGPAVDQAFGQMTGPMKAVMNAAKIMNQEVQAIQLTAADANYAKHKGAEGQRLFGTSDHIVSKGKNDTIKAGQQSYEDKLRASGDYSEKEIQRLVKMAGKEFGKEYRDKFDQAHDEATAYYDIRNGKSRKADRLEEKARKAQEAADKAQAKADALSARKKAKRG